jgi:hypothetical protein
MGAAYIRYRRSAPVIQPRGGIKRAYVFIPQYFTLLLAVIKETPFWTLYAIYLRRVKMKKNGLLLVMLGVTLALGMAAAGCASVPAAPSALEGYWRMTSTVGGAEAQAVVDEAMENAGQFWVFVNNVYYKGVGVLPHEKGTFIIADGNIELTPTAINSGIMANRVSWTRVTAITRMVYPEKSLPYRLNGEILSVVDIGIQQAYRKVDPFFTFDAKGNLIFQMR